MTEHVLAPALRLESHQDFTGETIQGHAPGVTRLRKGGLVYKTRSREEAVVYKPKRRATAASPSKSMTIVTGLDTLTRHIRTTHATYAVGPAEEA